MNVVACHKDQCGYPQGTKPPSFGVDVQFCPQIHHGALRGLGSRCWRRSHEEGLPRCLTSRTHGYSDALGQPLRQLDYSPLWNGGVAYVM
ncbi:hypothetical protein V2J09_013102 [Rumex salicifolius]